jgi:hypothetical protein
MNLLKYCLDFEDLEYLNPDAKVMSYPELNKIKDAKELFKDYRKIIILYLIQAKNKGHYVCLWVDLDNNIRFFDSAGFHMDDELDMLPKEKRIEYNQRVNQLEKLLKPYNVTYNDIQMQDEDYTTCGFWVTHRLKYDYLNEKEYLRFFDGVKNKDEYIIKEILNLK